MSDAPIYPSWLVRQNATSKKDLGDARFVMLGWTFHFKDGQLVVSTGDGVNVLQLGKRDTERFVDIVRALDQGRFWADFSPIEK